jgi:hypothetical protein
MCLPGINAIHSFTVPDSVRRPDMSFGMILDRPRH